MTLALPRDWPVCGARNQDARQRQRLCRARGDGWGQRCRHHGGLDIPSGPYAVAVCPAGVFLWRTERGVLLPGQGARQQVSWRIAVQLIESGAVTEGFFFGRKGSSLLRQLQAYGVGVHAHGATARTALGLTRYAFIRKAA